MGLAVSGTWVISGTVFLFSKHVLSMFSMRCPGSGPWGHRDTQSAAIGTLNTRVCLGHPPTKCLLKLSTVLQLKTSILPVAYEAPAYLSSLTAHFLLPYFVALACSSHFSFLSTPAAHLRAFAHTVPSAWYSFPLLLIPAASPSFLLR